jgi:nucleoside-diphosphate-sugar epimerase
VRCLVTGVAGFVGSHLAERLITLGHEVVGVDRFSDYYGRPLKEGNLARLHGEARFQLAEVDLAQADVRPLLDGCEVVFHQAAQAGVRASWGRSFEAYLRDNVLATQRLLEAAKEYGALRKLVYASTSSVYGDTVPLPMRESSLTAPYSPYGVTKLAAENLCELYRNNFGLPTIALRYFTVYGPRQRPDMAFHRFMEAILDNRPIGLFGDGEQTRDFTFVADIVEANMLAAREGVFGVYNVGGGSRVTVNEVLSVLSDITGPVKIERQPKEAGDMAHTWADISAASKAIGYKPRVSLREGLAAQFEWHKARRR